jgi:hypothetical protein
MKLPDGLHEAYSRFPHAICPDPAITGLAIGFREEGGRILNEPALRVYVRKGCAPARLPREFRGFPVSVICPRVDLWSTPVDAARHSTLLGGIKISSFLEAGTLAAVVRRNQTGELVGLTCAHVVGLTAAGFSVAPIYQPDFPQFIAGMPLDPTDAVGDIIVAEGAFQPTPTFPPQIIGAVDAAIFRLDTSAQQGRTASRGVAGLVSSITAVADVRVGQMVRKRGFVTGVTTAAVIAVGGQPVPWTVPNALPNSLLAGQVELTSMGGVPFGEKGDSGAMVLDALTPTAVGLLWAGGPTRAFMSPISAVQDRMGISVVW